MSNATLAAPSEAILNGRDETGKARKRPSAVSWGAIVAGAVVASALSLALLMLGAGIGYRVGLSVVDHQRLGHDVRDPRSSLVHRGSAVRIRRRRISGGSPAHALGQRPRG
jgi:hypothetical protein